MNFINNPSTANMKIYGLVTCHGSVSHVSTHQHNNSSHRSKELIKKGLSDVSPSSLNLGNTRQTGLLTKTLCSTRSLLSSNKGSGSSLTTEYSTRKSADEVRLKYPQLFICQSCIVETTYDIRNIIFQLSRTSHRELLLYDFHRLHTLLLISLHLWCMLEGNVWI